MTESEFYHLYANVNSIAELALRDLAAGGSMSAGPAIDAGKMAEFSELDFSALEGLDELVQQQAAALERFDTEVPAAAPPSGGEFDLSAYLARAYSLGADVRARIDAHRRSPAGLEVESKAIKLQRESRGLATLLGPLTAENMTEWLALYAEGSAVLDELVIAVRKLDGV